jgi:hypothetical protein
MFIVTLFEKLMYHYLVKEACPLLPKPECTLWFPQ